MRKIIFALVIACILITAGCNPAKQEASEMQTLHTENGNNPTLWVCYDCGHEDNNGEVCAVCGERPNDTVTSDGVIEIVYPENPSTGFVWSCTVTPEGVLEQADGGYQSDMSPEELNDSNPPVGVGGMRTYRFRPVKDGKVTLSFTLARGSDEISMELIYTYEVKDGLPTQVVGPINTWICDCGRTHNRVEQFCGICERAMPGLEDGWFCSECWLCHTSDEASCPVCGEARSYENDWVCTCGYVVTVVYEKYCQRCDTIPPSYAGGWICAGCDTVNPAVELCECCGEPDDHGSEAWICQCRHINNLSASPEECSNICAQCGKPRPAAGQ